MRTFIKYNNVGDIISVCRTEALSEGMSSPFGFFFQEGESFVEITETEVMSAMTLEQLHDQHRIDVVTRTMVAKGA